MNSHTWERAPLVTAVVSSPAHWYCQKLYDAAGEACMELTYSGWHKGHVISSLCPPDIGAWFGSVDNHKGSCLATGCLWHIVTPKKVIPILYIWHVTNASVRETTGCPPVTILIKRIRLPFFGHVARSDSRQGHHRATSASLRPPRDWKRLEDSHINHLVEGDWCRYTVG